LQEVLDENSLTKSGRSKVSFTTMTILLCKYEFACRALRVTPEMPILGLIFLIISCLLSPECRGFSNAGIPDWRLEP
jgi:hypothetical protein